MKIGTMDGLIDGLSQVVYDSGELTSADTSITISGLTGNIAEEYTLICRFVNDYAGTMEYGLRPNNDSASNYGDQYFIGSGASASAARITPTYITLALNSTQNYLAMCETYLYAKSGYVRTALTIQSNSVTGTTIGEVASRGQSWTNTADEITSLVVFANQTDGIGIGSRIILLKKVDVSSDMKTGAIEVQGEIENAWRKIYTNDLTSAAASVTMSGLTGDTDIFYRLICRFKDKDAVGNYHLRPNADSTADKYGYQQLMGRDSTASAARNTTEDKIFIGYTGTKQAYSFSETLLYAKSGYVRTALTQYMDEVVMTSAYPPAYSSTYVKATSQYSTWDPHEATDPALSLTGAWSGTSWLAAQYTITNQRFHIDLGSAKVVKRIYYENTHLDGDNTESGVKNFTFWGSNTGAGSFDDLVYGNDEGWTQLTTEQSTFDRHVNSDVEDPKYILVTNDTGYRYYAFKFADNHGSSDWLGLRHVVLQLNVSIYSIRIQGAVWNDTSTEITSLEISTQDDQMEIGTHIELWKLNL